jgi:hypothetical protein
MTDGNHSSYKLNEHGQALNVFWNPKSELGEIFGFGSRRRRFLIKEKTAKVLLEPDG